jgi:DNA-binding transcriptional ArsR family regulator
MPARRPVVTDPDTLAALAHPVRLDVLNYLMADGPATASTCARAVGDSPSNCSYHLRTLAKHGLVEPIDSADGRERPWRATITGFSTQDPDGDYSGPGGGAVLATALQLDQRRAREYLSRRSREPAAWRKADAFSFYRLRLKPAELAELCDQLDALIRPYLSATRTDAPAPAEVVSLSFNAFRMR